MSKPLSRPYLDCGAPGRLRYQGGKLLQSKDPPPVRHTILTLQVLRRHNTLEPSLQPTNRVLLRWAESGGTGIPNPDADIRELHYDPLPPDLQKKVDGILDESPWQALTRKWYMSNSDRKELATELRISRTQLYSDWRASLWYHTGRFEACGVHG